MLFDFLHSPPPLRKMWASLLAVGAAGLRHVRSGFAADPPAPRADLYRNLVEHTADPVYVLDMDEGFRMVFANDACCRHYGLGRERLYRLCLPDWDPHFGPGDLDPLKEKIRAGRLGTLETEHRLSDGRVVPVEVSTNYLVHGGHACVAGYFRDIGDRKRMENALRESEVRFHNMADAAPVLIWLADVERRYVWFNQGWLDFTGRTLEQECGDGWDGGIHPDDRARCLDVYRRNFDARLPFRREYRLRRHDGTYRWILDAGCPRFHEDGAFQGYIGSCIDITDHEETEESLARSRLELAAVVGSMDDLILEVGGDLRFRNCWSSDEGKLFLPREAFLGRAVDEVFDAEFAEPFLVVIRAVLEGGEPQSVDYASPVPGDPRWFNARISRRLQEGESAPGAIVVIRDVTERFRMEADLRLSERRLEERNRELDSILNLSPDGFVSFDESHRVKYASPAFLHLFGVEEGALIGQDAEAFGVWLHSREASQVGETIEVWLRRQFLPGAAETGPEPALLELAVPLRCLEARARRNEGEAVSVILYFHDVTERMEVDRMKSDFLSTAAHELRTPLASIHGFTELLLTDEDFGAATRREMLEIIFRQSGLIGALVNELLDLARIEARRGKDFVFEELDAGELAREAIAAADPEGGQGRWPLRLALTESVNVRGDANKLRQALHNVLSNAHKYSPDGGEISVSLKRAPGEVGIEIGDHGIGMSPEQVVRVCDRFYRADSTGSIPGTGLGMCIVKEIVTLHRGRLEIQSEPGLGTQVTLWLPENAAGTERS